MIICADDFGLSEDINRAIIDLVKCRRVSAVSCMVALDHFDRHAFSQLLRFRDHVDVGLHLTLTDIRPVGNHSKHGSLTCRSGAMHSLGRVFRRSLRRGIRSADVMHETAAQYARFLDFAGHPPVFLDSHLHVHQFPGIRKGVIRFLEGVDHAPYVRNTAMSTRDIARIGVSRLKCHAIGRLGQVFRSAVVKRGLRTNDAFAGVYDYRQYRRFPHFLGRFVECMEYRNSIVMVHPGEVEPWRRLEYETLRAADDLTSRLNTFHPKHA